MGRLRFTVALREADDPDRATCLREDLGAHLGALVCREHGSAMAIDFSHHGASLVGTVSPCCATASEQVGRHLSCAEEIAAMHGLEIRIAAEAAAEG